MEKTRVEFLFNFQMIDRLTFSDDVFEISFCQNQSIARYETLGIQVLNIKMVSSTWYQDKQ